MLCDDHGSGLGFVNAHDEHEHTSDGLNITPSHYQLNFRKISRRSLTMAVPGCRGCARSTPRLRNHVDGAARASSPIVAGARGDGQWGKAADAQEPASKQVLVAVGASQETEKGPAT